MKNFAGIFYAFLILGMLFASFFIVFHLANYSVNRRIARFTMLFFVVGTALLIISNVTLFFSIPSDAFSNFLPNSPGTSGF